MRRIILIVAGLLAVGLGAYAQGTSDDVETATNNRRERRADLYILEQKGVVGENKFGLVQVMSGHENDAAAIAMVAQENKDRLVIYESVKAKNHQALTEIEAMNAKNFQCDVPSGTSIEVPNAQGSAYEWKVK
jgi:uncharacterized protein YdbL (DUF1318 family)